MKEILWRMLAFVVSRPLVADYLIARAALTPFKHIDGYMNRDWLFNPYSDKRRKRDWLPSIRVHHILRHDLDQHPHDHPWDARTIIMKGWYYEDRILLLHREPWMKEAPAVRKLRRPGDTATLNYGEFHQIVQVSPGGVHTLFFTWKFKGLWGFLVGDKKIPHKAYLAGERDA
jgi:hypothetical protein